MQPCPRCGYDLGARVPAACSACAGQPREVSLREPAGTWSGARAGAGAIFHGLRFLATTRGTKRWIVPPALLTFGAFAALFLWLWKLVDNLLGALRDGVSARADPDAWWLRRAFEWMVEHTALLVLAEWTGALLVLAVGFFAMLWSFSLVYEVLCGPFLDEIHGRIEQRWFGSDPRAERERPSGIEPAACARVTALALLAAVPIVVVAWFLGGAAGVALGLGGPLAVLAIAAEFRPAYGRWLVWRARVEARTLATSLEATAIGLVLLVCALPLLFVPLVGYPLFALAAGFTTAISLLDIPLSRRRWGLRLRLAFVLLHFPAVLSFGAVASLVFIVPVFGPLAMVPAASVGGLWLVCKLDKRALR